jgi:homoserine kinase
MNEIKVLSPATVANVVCGFDCLGFCLEEPNDELFLHKIDKKIVRIVNNDDFNLPTNPENNVAGVVLLNMLKAANVEFGFELHSTKRIKPGSGIGSSSASAVGAAFAANYLLGQKFTKLEVTEFAMIGEHLASQGRHADNIAPCHFGGFTLVRSVEPLDIVEISFPQLFVTIIHPQIEIKTSEARKMLPKEIPLKSAIQQWANVGGLVAGLNNGDYRLISRSLKDIIVEPIRKKLIPKFDEIISVSLEAGSLGGGISGSGPSVFTFSETLEVAKNVELAIRKIYETTDIEFNTYVSKISRKGVRVLT